MKNKETPFCEPAQRTKSYVTGEQKGVDDVIRSIAITYVSAPNRCITRKRHPNGNPNLPIVNELTVGCLYQS